MVSSTEKKKTPKKIKEELLPIVSDGVCDIDRVGNISQKENALSACGVTRRKVYEEIGRMLTSEKKVEKMEGGEIVTVWEPDIVIRARGVELALKAFGDLKEMDRVVGNVTHNTVIYQWKSSPTVVQI